MPIFAKLKERYDAKEKLIGPEAMRYHERMIMLSVLDSQWKDHLRDMDHLKEGIGLRGYGQHDPLVEYKRESFDMFEAMMQRFQEETVRYLYLMQIMERPQVLRGKLGRAFHRRDAEITRKALASSSRDGRPRPFKPSASSPAACGCHRSDFGFAPSPPRSNVF
jgi:preprotein translocase subunit SecA